MRDLESARPAAEARLDASRREAEERLAALRATLSQELGVVPKKAYLLLLLAAGAAGFALALRRFKRRRLRG